MRRKTLEIRELQLSDAGVYTCVAENHLGSVEWNYTLYVNRGYSSVMIIIAITRTLYNALCNCHSEKKSERL